MAPERPSIIPANQLKNSNAFPGGVPFSPINVPSSGPPPLPPRQINQSYGGYNEYRPLGGNYYGSYGYGSQYRSYGGYGGFNAYSPYSGNYSGYNNYGSMGGPSGDAENRFLQYAEESTRSTFRVVETVLQTFSSMTMLLESTYFAMTNSFRAILSVADNIGKLRSTLGQLLSTFAIIRFLKWMYRKLTRTAGFRKQESTDEDELWERSFSKIIGDGDSGRWTGFIMFSVFVMLPVIIHRITSSVKKVQLKGPDPTEWGKSSEPIYTATVLYDFVAANPEELTIRSGQKVLLAPQSLQPKNSPGWIRATYDNNVGLIPYNYIQIVGQLKRKPKVENVNENPLVNEDPMTNGWPNDRSRGDIKIAENSFVFNDQSKNQAKTVGNSVPFNSSDFSKNHDGSFTIDEKLNDNSSNNARPTES